jgi:hypothetical protein
MRQGFSSLVMLAVALASTAILAQPPGAGNYFGAGRDSKFDPNSMLKTAQAPSTLPAVPPPAPPAPVGGTPTVPPPLFGDAGNDPLLPPMNQRPKLWTGGGEIGLNGATGNTELFNLRIGLNGRRKSGNNVLESDFLYTLTQTGSVTTQQQALFNARDEVLFAGTPWSAFASTNIEYDELRAFKFRVGVYGGVGYSLIDDGRTNWRVRAGAGIVREFGRSGVADRWVPEAVFGTDFTRALDDRQSLVANLDYYPRIDDWGQYRVRARVAYQILLDPNSNLMLRIGVQDRFDSAAGAGINRNDLNYFASLGWTF